MKNVMTGRLGGLMKEKEKSCHAELVSASTACIICYRWPLLTVMATTQLVDSESSSQ